MRSPIERASANDVVTLATDRGPAPMNIGAVLIVDDAADLDFATVTSVLESRLPRVRRLRQRLIRTPPGCGRPVWVDDPGFDLSRHLSQIVLPLRRLQLRIPTGPATSRSWRSRPPWSVRPWTVSSRCGRPDG